MRRRAFKRKIAYALVSLLLSVWTGAGVCVSENLETVCAIPIPLNGRAEEICPSYPKIPDAEADGSSLSYAEIPYAEIDADGLAYADILFAEADTDGLAYPEILCTEADGSGESALLPLNQRWISGAGEAQISARAARAGEYILYAFSEGEVEASVRVSGGALLSGTLPLRVTLEAGEVLTARLRAESPYTLDIMRASLGRCFENPLEMTGNSVNRTITRAQDVHWLCYTAEESGEYRFLAQRALKSGITPCLLALDERGNALGDVYECEDAAGVFVQLGAGESCFLRVCAPEDETGSYALSVQNAEGALPPVEISLPFHEIRLETGAWERVSPAYTPYGAVSLSLWTSSDPDIATVNAQGVVEAVGEGECTVRVLGFGGTRGEIRVTVERARLTGLSFAVEEIEITEGEAFYLAWNAEPEYAAPVDVVFFSSDETVARVDADGCLSALRTGETAVTVQTADGQFSANAKVRVIERRSIRRALVVGMAAYSDGRTRMGCVNTTQGISDALSQSRFSSSRYLTDMRVDLSREELLNAIDEAFSGAAECDVSLFYINCHGNSLGGVAWLETSDGGKIAPRELEQALRRVPGQVVVIIDCCFSGAFIGQAARADEFSRGVISAFSQDAANTKSNAFSSSRYRVLVSSSFDQNSYRIASSSPVTESGMSTVFARALAEGLGWDLMKDKTVTLKADLDKNRAISFTELYQYCQKRCMYYLTRSPASASRQSVQAWPEGSPFILAE